METIESPEIKAILSDLGKDAAFDLVKEIIRVESSGNPYAVRYEDHFKYVVSPHVFARLNGISADTEMQCQKMSLGLMQLMGGTARSLGYKGQIMKLLDPKTNLEWGVKYLIQLGNKYGWGTADQVAAYNAGSARRDLEGKLVNNPYVVKVLGVKYV